MLVVREQSQYVTVLVIIASPRLVVISSSVCLDSIGSGSLRVGRVGAACHRERPGKSQEACDIAHGIPQDRVVSQWPTKRDKAPHKHSRKAKHKGERRHDMGGNLANVSPSPTSMLTWSVMDIPVEGFFKRIHINDRWDSVGGGGVFDQLCLSGSRLDAAGELEGNQRAGR